MFSVHTSDAGLAAALVSEVGAVVEYYIEAVDFLAGITVQLPFLAFAYSGPDLLPLRLVVQRAHHNPPRRPLANYAAYFAAITRLLDAIRSHITALASQYPPAPVAAIEDAAIWGNMLPVLFTAYYQLRLDTVRDLHPLVSTPELALAALNARPDPAADVLTGDTDGLWPAQRLKLLECLDLGRLQQRYPHNTPLHHNLIRLHVARLLATMPHCQNMFEEAYENLILRRINNNEAHTSPTLFTDRECKVLDIMEILTFNLDTVATIVEVVVAYLYVIGTGQRGGASTSSDDMVHCQTRVDALTAFVANEVDPLIAEFCDAGTVTLSKDINLRRTLELLQHFGIVMMNVVVADRVVQAHRAADTDADSDSHLFYRLIDYYISDLRALLKTVAVQYQKLDSLSGPDVVAALEAVDDIVKDEFFLLQSYLVKFRFNRLICVGDRAL